MELRAHDGIIFLSLASRIGIVTPVPPYPTPLSYGLLTFPSPCWLLEVLMPNVWPMPGRFPEPEGSPVHANLPPISSSLSLSYNFLTYLFYSIVWHSMYLKAS